MFWLLGIWDVVAQEEKMSGAVAALTGLAMPDMLADAGLFPFCLPFFSAALCAAGLSTWCSSRLASFCHMHLASGACCAACHSKASHDRRLIDRRPQSSSWQTDAVCPGYTGVQKGHVTSLFFYKPLAAAHPRIVWQT